MIQMNSLQDTKCKSSTSKSRLKLGYDKPYKNVSSENFVKMRVLVLTRPTKLFPRNLVK